MSAFGPEGPCSTPIAIVVAELGLLLRLAHPSSSCNSRKVLKGNDR
jgi:hypothetical protein